MSAAYYDFYAEEGSTFIVKINMLDKFNTQVCLRRPNGSTESSPDSYIDVPTELSAIGYEHIYKIDATMLVKPNIAGTGSATGFEFSGNSFGEYPSSGGKLYLKGKNTDDHNLVLYYPQIEIGTAGTYFYDFQLKYFRGNRNGAVITSTEDNNTLRILQGRFIVIPKVQDV